MGNKFGLFNVPDFERDVFKPHFDKAVKEAEGVSGKSLPQSSAFDALQQNPNVPQATKDQAVAERQAIKNALEKWKPETRPFDERWGFRKVNDVFPFETLTRRSARHLNPVSRRVRAPRFVAGALLFALSTTLYLKKPLPESVGNWERKARANEIRDRNFEKPILHHKRGEPVVIPEGFRTHKFPESVALGGKVPEHYEEIYGDEQIELKAQKIVAREMDAKIAQLDAILKERALALAKGSDS